MTDSPESDADKMPDDEELQEPSTEKEVGEEPKDADADEEEPDHRAVGVGVTDAASDEDQVSPPHPTAAESARADSAPPTSAVTDDVRRDAAGVDGSDDSTP